MLVNHEISTLDSEPFLPGRRGLGASTAVSFYRRSGGNGQNLQDDTKTSSRYAYDFSAIKLVFACLPSDVVWFPEPPVRSCKVRH
jgi:hypothetical protein